MRLELCTCEGLGPPLVGPKGDTGIPKPPAQAEDQDGAWGVRQAVELSLGRKGHQGTVGLVLTPGEARIRVMNQPGGTQQLRSNPLRAELFLIP